MNVRARCVSCGDVTLPASAVVVHVASQAVYCYVCPRCHKTRAKTCSPAIVELLVGAGCPSNRPAELDDPHPDEPIAADEQLDYYLALYSDADWISELVPRLTD